MASISGNLKKHVPAAMALLCAAAMLVWCLALPVSAIGTAEKTSSAVFDSGWIYLNIADANGQTSQVKITLTVKNKPSYKNYLKQSTSYDCALSVNAGDQNVHNITLNQSTVSTQLAGSSNYTALVLSLSYTQHANYKYTGQSTDRPTKKDGSTIGRFNTNNTSGQSTIVTDVVHADTKRTINVQVYAGLAGLITWDDTDGKHYRTNGTKLTLNYAKPVYTASFQGNGNTSGSVGTQYRYCGERFQLTNGFVKTGHNFSGWSGSDGKTYSNGASVTAYGNMTFTANWTPWQHTIVYDANGGSGAPGNQTKTYGSSLTLSSVVPKRSGCVFAGWISSGGGTYQAQDTYGYDQNGGTVTLTASWSAYLDLNGLLDGSSSGSLGEYGTADVYINGTLKAEGISDFYQLFPLGTGYEIKNIQAKSGKRYVGTASGSAPLTGTLQQLTGVRLVFETAEYTVVYDGNGGTGATEHQTGICDTSFELAKNSFARPGYTFTGWSKDKKAAVPEYTQEQSVTNLAEASQTVTLYAIWKKTDASWQLDNVVEDDRMFSGDGKIRGQAGTAYDKDHVDSSYARVDEPADQGYFTRKK